LSGTRGTAVTVGTFDGIHLGHHDVLRALEARARRDDVPAVLVTFDPHPLAVVNPRAAPALLTPGIEQRAILAAVCPPALAVVVPFTRWLAARSAEEFVTDVLLRRYRMASLVVGYDHGLGRGREGDIDTLVALGDRHGFAVEVVPARIGMGGVPVSSTTVRRAVAYGDLGGASAALGRSYSLEGRVIRGAGRGGSLGYPTLNLEVPPAKLLPPHGVYAVRVRGRLGEFGGMMNLGTRPTFGDAALSIEAHLFGAEGSWYDHVVSVELVARIRDVMRFDGPQALVEQLGRDADSARRALTQA
jgi:riboflavin kinase/FMN adenylyltransferase